MTGQLKNDDPSALSRLLAMPGPLDTAAIRDGLMMSMRAWDFNALTTLLTRYLEQPLSDSERAWAYMHLANALAVGERALEAVRMHETFEAWLPGKSPRLSSRFPFYAASEEPAEATWGPDEIRAHVLGQSVEFATAYGAISRYEEYMSKVDAAMARLNPTQHNVELRFYSVRIYLTAAHIAGDFERAERFGRSLHTIADGAGDPEGIAELHATARMSEIQIAQAKNDSGAVEQILADALSLLGEMDRDGSSQRPWVRGHRHELAHHLIQSGRYDLALPLLDAVLATGGHFGGGYGWMMHAAAVWQVTHNRSRVLALLRDARANDGRDLLSIISGSAFEGLSEDPEFQRVTSLDSR